MKIDEFKVNDEVWDTTYGWGNVVSLNGDIDLPVVVIFENGYNTLRYTKDGRQSNVTSRTLFFEEITIPDSAYKRPKWRAEKFDAYFFVAGTGLLLEQKEFGNIENNAHYETGNYFKSEQQAKESKFYKVFHEEK